MKSERDGHFSQLCAPNSSGRSLQPSPCWFTGSWALFLGAKPVQACVEMCILTLFGMFNRGNDKESDARVFGQFPCFETVPTCASSVFGPKIQLIGKVV